MSTARDRRVILHVGIPKTGSSALQVAFVRNRELLERHGFTYPRDPANPRMDVRAMHVRVTSRNATSLRNHLLPRAALRLGIDPDAGLKEVLGVLDAQDGESSVLFSSEFLYSCDLDRLATLARACADRGFGLEVAGYVRNIAGHAYSGYVQRVKRHRFTGSFADYIEPNEATRDHVMGGDCYHPSLRSWVEGMREVLGSSAVRVHHYDSVRRNLVPHFFAEQLSVPTDDLVPDLEHTVNRSLTPDEVLWMRRLNARLDQPLASRLVSDLIIGQPPTVPQKPTISRADRDRLVQLFADEIAWLNDNGIEGGELAVDCDGVLVLDGPSDESAATASEETLTRVLATLANQRAQRLTESRAQRRRKPAGTKKTEKKAAARKTAAPPRRRRRRP